MISFSFNNDSLYKNEEMILNNLNNEIEYNFSISNDCNKDFEQLEIFNEIKKVFSFNDYILEYKDTNDEDHYLIDKNKIKDLNKNNNAKINETFPQNNNLNIMVKLTKRGRKLKNSNEERNHNKKTFDNLLRRIKHCLLKGLKVLINKKIKDVFQNDEKLSFLKILTLDQKQSNNSSVEFNRLFIHNSIKDIFSGKLTTKYKRKDLEKNNEESIKTLLSVKDIEKRNIFENIFNLEFIDVVNFIVGKRNDLVQLNELRLTEKFLKDILIDEEYSKIIFYTMENMEEILKNKKSRKRNKKMI